MRGDGRARDDVLDHWRDRDALVRQQEVVGSLQPPMWQPDAERSDDLLVAGCFVAFARGEAGPGAAGDRAWVGACLVDADGVQRSGAVVRCTAGGPYVPGLLALREGPMVVEALERLLDVAGRPDVVVLDATGRDHPRRCGLAVHLGWAIDLPTIGVTHRMLTARHREPPALRRRGDTEPIREDGETVAAWVCTRAGTRPLVAHAGWRTDAAFAAELAVRTATRARTPEPLRRARELARTARAVAGAG